MHTAIGPYALIMQMKRVFILLKKINQDYLNISLGRNIETLQQVLEIYIQGIVCNLFD